MEILLGKVIAIYLIVFGLGMLWNRDFFLAAVAEFMKSKALMVFGGALSLIIGLLLVFSHNVWTNDWQVIITIFGWASLLKGLGMVFFPEHMVKKAKMISAGYGIQVGAMVAFLLGLYLLYGVGI